MPAMPMRTFTRGSPWRAIAAALFSRNRYLLLAAEHAIAVSLSSPDFRAAYEKGEYPKSGWEQDAIARAQVHLAELINGLGRALLTTVAFAFVGLALAFAFGKINPSMPFAAGKVLSLVGASLAAWATLFELGGYTETMKGQALHELVHPAIFKLIFLPGVAIATLGQVW